MCAALKITIITPVFNGEKYLEETIQSVIGQSYNNIEYIIVDGQSADNTLEIINAYRDRISHVIVERDHSMYEAINRGIKAASGDYMLVLNSDDCLVNNNTIQEVVNFIGQNPGCLGYYGNLLKREGESITKRKVFQITRRNLLFTEHGTIIPHPGLFVHRSRSLASVGLYDLSYRYASDFDYILRLLENGQVKYMNIYVSIFRIHQDSITSSGKINGDRLDILSRYGDSTPTLVKSFYYYLIWFTYKIFNILENRK